MSEAKASPNTVQGLPSNACYAIFVVSGFAGLVYEATWARYLKGILGHEAYAQALVLGIFLGGLAIGSALSGKHVHRMRYPLIGYAVVEAVLALMAVVFHDIFVATREVLDAGLGATETARWLAGVVLLLPQAVLLGTTFPMLAAAVVRGNEAKAGRIVAWLYCSNSMGGVLGVLAVGTVLVELGGLPGSMLFAALASATAGLLAWVLHHRYSYPTQQFVEPDSGRENAGVSIAVLSLIAAGTGLASLIYEIVWVRMLALVLGSSTRSFEFMLAAFIFGLALGSFFVQRWVGRQDRLLILAKIQLLMGTLAIAGIFYYQAFFFAIPGLRSALPPTDLGYSLYGSASFLLALLFMIGPTFCAGMTLPLLTRSAMATRGESALGSIYAWNTLGSITGIVLAVFVLLPLLGLKFALLVGAAIDLALGVLLLRWAQPRRLAWGLGAAAAVLAIAMVFPPYNRYLLSSGPYRSTISENWSERDDDVLYYQDGSTLSAAVVQDTDDQGNDARSLMSNGRSEGSQYVDYLTVSDDAFISEFFATLSLLYHPEARRAAVIGYGLGLASSTLLRSSNLEQVVTLEIEKAVVDAGGLFPERASRPVINDPRSQILVTDAKSYFASQRGEPFDIIVSLPSHPWVSGVSSLYTKEHFAAMKRALAEDGVLVQWVHIYEFGPKPFATIIGALNESFPDYLLYVAHSNVAIIMSPDPSRLKQLDPNAWQELPQIAEGLKDYSLHSIDDVAAYGLASKQVFQPYIDSYRMQANSDYFPVLDIEAARAFYFRTNYSISQTLLEMRNVFFSSSLADRQFRKPFAEISNSDRSLTQQRISLALSLIDESAPIAESLEVISELLTVEDQTNHPLRALFVTQCGDTDDENNKERLVGFVWLMRLVQFQFQPEEFAVFWKRFNEELPCVAALKEARLAEDAEITKDLFAFYDAVAASDHDKVLELGNALLPVGQATSQTQALFLLQMMDSGLRSDNPDVTLELSYRAPREAPAAYRHAVRLLGSHALARLGK